jgi:hypothetical protein
LFEVLKQLTCTKKRSKQTKRTEINIDLKSSSPPQPPQRTLALLEEVGGHQPASDSTGDESADEKVSLLSTEGLEFLDP